MTYGETSAELQQALAELLVRFRRVSRHLGGAVGRYPATRPAAERAQLSALAQRYRWPVLLWARDAAVLAAPPALRGSVTGYPGLRVSRALAAWTPPARDLPDGRGPSVGELGTAHEVPVLEAWRRAAVAAVEARERDLPAVRAGPPLAPAECRDVARDVMAVADALVILDRRWADSDPAWQLLGPEGTKQSLTRSGRQVRALVDLIGPPTWTVDDRGSPARTGNDLAGAGDAWSRIAAAIAQSDPSATALRRVIRTTALARAQAAGLARQAGREDLAAAWSHGAEALAQLSRQLRNVASLAPGDDARTLDAVHEAQAWLEHPGAVDSANLDLLAVGFDQAEHAIGVQLEHGIRTRTYLGAFTSRLEHRAIGGVRHARPYFEAITSENHPDLLASAARLTRTLPPSPPRPAPHPGRAALADALQARRARATGTTPPPRLSRGVVGLIAEQRAAQARTDGPGLEGPR